MLSSDFYVIPRFQRAYSWTQENLDDFWRDVVHDNDDGYFIGPMVAFKHEKDTLAIVDGQQRLTSLTLTICAIRDQFQQIGARALAEALGRYIERQDDDTVSHFVLRSDGAGDYIHSQIQRPKPRSLTPPSTDEQKSLKRAFDDVSLRLDMHLEEFSNEHPDGAEKSPAATELRKIRDRILSLQVIWITLDNEDDAYVIFETLNSRGKDLETADLLKNLILNYVRAENGDLDSARSKWNAMRLSLAEAGGGANPNTFILHWWLSSREYTAERKLFRLIRRQTDKSQAADLLNTLVEDAELYARIASPENWKCGSHEKEIQRSLQALNLFSVRQPRPLVLALLRAHRDGRIKIAKVKKVLRAIESYHFISTAVVGVSSTGGISVMYASHARQVSGAETEGKLHVSLDKLVEKLADGASSRDTFVNEFGRNLFYSSERPSQRRVVAYTLTRIHDELRQGAAFDHSKCNIEHISPQSKQEPWMAGIGNLLWIDSTLNAKLGDKGFEEKRSILEGYSKVYDVEDIVSATEWDSGAAERRAERLAEIGFDTVWRIR